MSISLVEQLSTKKTIQKIIPLALSMGGAQLMTVAGGFLCIMMLAHLGHQILAASALIISTQISIMVIGMSLLFSLSVLIGHSYGAKDYSAIGNYLQHAWTLAVVISIPIIFLFWFIGPVLTFFHEPPEVIPEVVRYFHAYVFAVLPFMWLICNQQLCYGTQQQRLVIIASAVSVGILLTSAYILIFGKFGFPALGVAGLGYAMAAQAWTSLIFLSLFLKYHNSFKKYNLFSYRAHKNIDYLAKMFKIGWPMALQMSAEMICFFAIGLMTGWIGSDALAASQIVNQFVFLTVVPVFALSQACAIVVGQARGAQNFYEIKNLGYAGLQIALFWSLMTASFFIFFPNLLASFYLNPDDTHNAHILNLVRWLFLLAAFSQTFDSVRNVMTGALRGLFDTRFPMYIGILALWLIAIPLAYLFAFIFSFGVYGIAFGFTLGMLSGGILVLLRWRHQSALLIK